MELYRFVSRNNVNMVKKLLTTQIDVNYQNESFDLKYTSLHKACYYNYLDIIKLLLKDNRIDVNRKDAQGSTAYHNIFYNFAIDTALLLFNDDRVDLNMQNYNGDTPLHVACYYNNINVVKIILLFYLEYKYVNLNIKNNYGKTAKDIAKTYNYIDIVKCIEEYEKNRNDKLCVLKSSKQDKYLYFCSNGMINELKSLLEQKRKRKKY